MKRELLDYVFQQYQDGRSWSDIANELDVSDVLLIYHARKHGVASRTVSQAATKIKIDGDNIKLKYESGMSIVQLAGLFGCSYSVMRQKLLDAGVVLRTIHSNRSCKSNKTPRWLWENREWLDGAYNKSLASIKAISKHVGWGYATINGALKYFEIEPRQNTGPTSGHVTSPTFPQFIELDTDSLSELLLNNTPMDEIAQTLGLTITAVEAAKVTYSLNYVGSPITRTGPSRDALSKASLSKWSDEGFRHRVTKSNTENWTDPVFRDKMAIARLEHPTISGIQLQLYDILDELNVEYVKESLGTKYGYYSFDCKVPNYRDGRTLLIEVQGDYWHSLNKVKANDCRKFALVSKYFPDHDIVYIWEHEFRSKELIADKILCKLGRSIQCDFKLSDLIIKELTYDESKTFIDSYHYIGSSCRSTDAYGCFLRGELIAAVVYAPPVRQNVAQQFGGNKLVEMSRFCIKPGYHKHNLASWFLSRTNKLIDCDILIAYSDKTAGHDGTIYKSLNFVLHHTVKPDYWYIGETNSVLHKKTLYNRAKADGLTENEYAEKYLYIKKYGGEKFCFIKRYC